MIEKIKYYISVYFNLPFIYKHGYFSQEGEDLILQKIFSNKKRGFYVDIGAHHPYRYSNTHLLYKKGWQGINIDPTPGVIKLFNHARKRDINLELAIDDRKGNKLFFLFKDYALNTFSKKYSDQIIKTKQSQFIKKITITTYRLENILKKYLKRKNVDLLNIDVEGLELNVLRSNNWAKYKPYVIVVENLTKDKKIANYLKKLKYYPLAKTLSSQVYVRS